MGCQSFSFRRSRPTPRGWYHALLKPSEIDDAAEARNTHTHTYTYTHTHIHTHTHTNTHTHTHTDARAHTHTYTYTHAPIQCMHAYNHICIHHADIQTYRHADLYIRKYTYTRTHTHTRTSGAHATQWGSSTSTSARLSSSHALWRPASNFSACLWR